MKKGIYLSLLMAGMLLMGCQRTTSGTENTNTASNGGTHTETDADVDADMETEAQGKNTDEETPDGASDETAVKTDFSYADLSETEFLFASGAGAWGTTLTIDADGSFQGLYTDSDNDTGEGYPNGTMYYCKFSGQLGSLTKVDDLTYTADLLTISYADPVGEEAYEDGIRYIYSEAYGLDQAGTLTFYLPGTRREKLSEDCLSWVSQAMVDENWNPVDELDFVCLYNPAEEEAFYSYNQVDQWLNHLTSCEETEQYYLDELQNLETQGDMTENARNRFRLWDNALNEEWKILMTLLPEEEKESLRAEERTWISRKEQAVEEAGAEAAGGSLQPMLEYDEAAELTKERVYELKEMLNNGR